MMRCIAGRDAPTHSNSNTVTPGGFAPGSYGWEVVTAGIWILTVLAW
jgi:hypothetical protein